MLKQLRNFWVVLSFVLTLSLSAVVKAGVVKTSDTIYIRNHELAGSYIYTLDSCIKSAYSRKFDDNEALSQTSEFYAVCSTGLSPITLEALVQKKYGNESIILAVELVSSATNDSYVFKVAIPKNK